MSKNVKIEFSKICDSQELYVFVKCWNAWKISLQVENLQNLLQNDDKNDSKRKTNLNYYTTMTWLQTTLIKCWQPYSWNVKLATLWNGNMLMLRSITQMKNISSIISLQILFYFIEMEDDFLLLCAAFQYICITSSAFTYVYISHFTIH